MNEKRIKLLGLIGFVIICLLALFYNAERIQNDIHTRSASALLGAAVFDASVETDGRDVTLTGFVGSQAEKDKAGDIVYDLFGVRSVNNLLEVIKEAPKETVTHPLPEEDERVRNLSDLSKNILFQPEKAILDNRSFETLDRIALLLNEYDDLDIVIEGHTDSFGEPELNLELSKARAEVVKNYLISKDVVADRMTTMGYGITVPIADNSTAEGRAINRRVEFKLSEEK